MNERAEELFRELTFRPRATPSPGIPLGARSAGHYRLSAGQREDSLPKHFLQVFWGVAGSGTVRFDREERVLGAGDVAVCIPGMEHHLRVVESPWEYRWWTMDGPLAMEMLTATGLRPDIVSVGPAPVALFEGLTAALKDLTFAGERKAGALAYALLSEIMAGRPARSGRPWLDRALATVHRRWSEPGFGVEALAAALGMHRSTLAREFKAAQGMSPASYLAGLRVQNALALLKESSLSVSEIGARCGYADPNYFSRVVRRHSGLSPLQFRRR